MQLESALQILAIEIKYVQDAFRKAEWKQAKEEDQRIERIIINSFHLTLIFQLTNTFCKAGHGERCWNTLIKTIFN